MTLNHYYLFGLLCMGLTILSGCPSDTESIECTELEQGDTRCSEDGRATQRCRSDGQWSTVQTCNEGQQCKLQSNGTSACVDLTQIECQTEGAVRCASDLTATEQCLNGQWSLAQQCPTNQTCQTDAQNVSQCAETQTSCDSVGETRCAANDAGVEQCRSNGKWQLIPCQQDDQKYQVCQLNEGGASTCVDAPNPNNCQPMGGTRCTSDGLATESCRSDGKWQVTQRCVRDDNNYQECQLNANGTSGCVDIPNPNDCQLMGATRCTADGAAKEECRSDGKWGVTQMCQKNDRLWQECQLNANGTSGCVDIPNPNKCQPMGDTRCNAAGTAIEQCRSDGRWGAILQCKQYQECQLNADGKGQCTNLPDPNDCQPLGAMRCASGDTGVEQCRSDGKWGVIRTCTANQQCLPNANGTSSCADIPDPNACQPSSGMRCTPDGRFVEQCRSDGQWGVIQTCTANQQCLPNANGTSSCADIPDPNACQPLGATRCTPNGAATERCRSNGNWEVVQTCQTNQQCQPINGASGCRTIQDPNACPVLGATRCTPDGLATEGCRSNGRWEIIRVCIGFEECLPNANGGGGCVAMPNPNACQPLGATRCTPDSRATQRCRSNGNWEIVQTCTHIQQCQTNINGSSGCITIGDPNACTDLGKTRCTPDGKATERCRSNGNWEVVQTCTNAQECQLNASGGSSCVDIPNLNACQPLGATRCTADARTAERCRSNGNWEAVQSCTDTQTCSQGACIEIGDPNACAPQNATRCSQDLASVERCRNDGQWSNVQNCMSNQVCEYNNAAATCVTNMTTMYPAPTINDSNSVWYERGCALVQYSTYKSDLDADCRCGTNQAPTSGVPRCRRPYEAALQNITVGQGPSFANIFNARYTGGFLDEANDALYASVSYGASTARKGAVVKVTLSTGQRQILSGSHPSLAQEVGTGPSLQSVMDVRRTTSGQLLAYVRTTPPAQQEIYQIDPTTGNRLLVWKAGNPQYGQCGLQTTDTGFIVDSSNRVYLGFANPFQGRGIIRLSADFQTCEVLTGTGAILEAQRGQGPAIGGFIQGFVFKGNTLHAFSTQPKQFFSVDLQTGDRTVLLQPSSERWAVWDATRSVWWLAGFLNSVSVDAWDPMTNAQASIFSGGSFGFMPLGASGPIRINSLNYGPMWLRGNGNLLFGQDAFSIVEFEPSTGNSIILSL